MSRGNYLQNFKSREDIAKEFRTNGGDYDVPDPTILSTLRGTDIHIAWYGYGSYCGSALVLYTKDGKLYEVNGSHCSCYGLEGQWNPEETSWAAVAKYVNDYRFDGEYDGSAEARAKLQKLVDKHLGENQ